MDVLESESVRNAIRTAWQESQPGTDAAHEEGGFILLAADGSLGVERWPKGEQDKIFVPPHAGGKRNDGVIVATFHTHPNPGADYEQEPSLTDIRAVRLDPDLGHPDYEGEYVIAFEHVYRIKKSGDVETIGATGEVLKIS